MTNPQFPDQLGMREVVRPGATASKAGPDMLQRVAALEQGALGRPGPEIANGCTITSDTSQTGGVKWKPGSGELACSMRNSSGTCAATANWIAITTQTNEYDYNVGTAQADTTNGRIYCRVAGLYRLTGGIGIASGGSYSGLKGVGFMVNGSLVGTVTHWVDDTTEDYRGHSLDRVLAAGDYVNLAFFNPAAVARTVDTNRTILSMSLIRAA